LAAKNLSLGIIDTEPPIAGLPHERADRIRELHVGFESTSPVAPNHNVHCSGLNLPISSLVPRGMQNPERPDHGARMFIENVTCVLDVIENGVLTVAQGNAGAPAGELQSILGRWQYTSSGAISYMGWPLGCRERQGTRHLVATKTGANPWNDPISAT
jgi:hypothetical protein